MILESDNKIILNESFKLAYMILSDINYQSQLSFFNKLIEYMDRGILQKIQRLLQENFDYIKLRMTKKNYKNLQQFLNQYDSIKNQDTEDVSSNTKKPKKKKEQNFNFNKMMDNDTLDHEEVI